MDELVHTIDQGTDKVKDTHSAVLGDATIGARFSARLFKHLNLNF